MAEAEAEPKTKPPFGAIHRHGFVRVAAASPRASTGDVAFNVAETLKLAKEADKNGVDLAVLEHVQPWLVAITLLDIGLLKLGYDPEHGLERYLVGKAKSDRKEIVGLETLEQQLGIFAGLPRKSQQALLSQTIEELDTADTTMSQLETAWREGHVETMTDKLLGDFDDFPELYPELVTKRNAAWTDALEKLLKDGHRYLVVVGALHLVGHDSVIERLGARGHRVERVGATH